MAPPSRIIEVSLVSSAEPASSAVRSVEGLKTQQRDDVSQKPEAVREPVFVDYGADEPGKCVREEAGRLFLHCQHLPREVRLAVPQPAHHAHLCVLQALPGTAELGNHNTPASLPPPVLRDTGPSSGSDPLSIASP